MEERDRLYYAHMTARDADREPTTLIVMRVRARGIWLSLQGSWRGTVVLSDEEVDHLTGLMIAAKAARGAGEA